MTPRGGVLLGLFLGAWLTFAFFWPRLCEARNHPSWVAHRNQAERIRCLEETLDRVWAEGKDAYCRAEQLKADLDDMKAERDALETRCRSTVRKVGVHQQQRHIRSVGGDT